MKRSKALPKVGNVPSSRIISRELEEHLRSTRIRQVHFGDGSTAPPVLAYVTNFPRLSVPLTGCHTMEIAHSGRTETIRPIRGHAVFVPDHAWNKPDWSEHVSALTFLFGVKQIGISLVRHEADSQSPPAALKTSSCRRSRHRSASPVAHRIAALCLPAAVEVATEAPSAQSDSHLRVPMSLCTREFSDRHHA